MKLTVLFPKDQIVVARSRMMEMQPSPPFERRLLVHNRFCDQVYIVHHRDRLAEHEPVDLLHQILAYFLSAIQGRVIGRVDIPGRNPAVKDQISLQPELPADIRQLFFYMFIVLQLKHHSFI